MEVKFDVLLLSYEMVAKLSPKLRALDWACLIVDEGHRLKSDVGVLHRSLTQFTSGFRLLLTGTPLQNNLKELFNLLQFIDPNKYSTARLQAQFEYISRPAGRDAATVAVDSDGVLDISESKSKRQKLSDTEEAHATKTNAINQLHDLLRPRILRRLKEETLKDMLPNKVSLVVPVGMSSVQTTIYSELLTRNYTILAGNGAKKAKLNLLMQLQKCCNHPYLFENTEKKDLPEEVTRRLLIEASGKLVLLDKMLVRLKQRGHRVLIFSHMTTLLDILEDYVRLDKKWGYCRLDGNTSAADRQLLIDRFNNKQEEYFVFLLSTLAGGLGINLASADTVILFDSDWNPHNDLQALSRCHRIGQQNKVMIYRFVTRNSVEEAIVQAAQKKLGLETVVVRSMRAGVDSDTIKAILHHGVGKLFNDSAAAESAIVYDDAAVEKLLDRTQQEVKPDSQHAPAGASDALRQYLGAFTVAQVWSDAAERRAAAGPAKSEPGGPVDWDFLIKEKYVSWVRQKDEELGRGKRRAVRDNSVPPSPACTEAAAPKAPKQPKDKLIVLSDDGSVSSSSDEENDDDWDTPDEPDAKAVRKAAQTGVHVPAMAPSISQHPRLASFRAGDRSNFRFSEYAPDPSRRSTKLPLPMHVIPPAPKKAVPPPSPRPRITLGLTPSEVAAQTARAARTLESQMRMAPTQFSNDRGYGFLGGYRPPAPQQNPLLAHRVPGGEQMARAVVAALTPSQKEWMRSLQPTQGASLSAPPTRVTARQSAPEVITIDDDDDEAESDDPDSQRIDPKPGAAVPIAAAAHTAVYSVRPPGVALAIQSPMKRGNVPDRALSQSKFQPPRALKLPSQDVNPS